MTATFGSGVCDFCAAPSPIWMFPASDFVSNEVTPEGRPASAGGWAACDPCREAVEAGIETLLDRAVVNYITMHPEFRQVADAVRVSLRDLYGKFYDHRTGPPEKIEDVIARCAHDRVVFMRNGIETAFLPSGFYCAVCGEPVPEEVAAP